ncbi:hypothetical protein C8R48DRAFT_774779 [Suillus tomentosus]|nr:hypothetical protein C8R48DRAFT_774779 [Suillus tomentosus]
MLEAIAAYVQNMIIPNPSLSFQARTIHVVAPVEEDDHDDMVIIRNGPGGSDISDHKNSDITLIEPLMDANVSLKAELARERGHCTSLQSAIATILATVKDCIRCEVCTGVLRRQYILTECGHSFCLRCLQMTLCMSLCDHVQFTLGMHRPSYTNESISAQQMAIIQETIHRLSECHLPLPTYKCPKCRSKISSRPIPAFALLQLADDVARLHKEFGQENGYSDTTKVVIDTVPAELTWKYRLLVNGDIVTLSLGTLEPIIVKSLGDDVTSPQMSVSQGSVAQLLLEDNADNLDIVNFPEVMLKNALARSTHDALARMLCALGRSSGDNSIYAVEWFISIGRYSRTYSRTNNVIAALWCAARILEGISGFGLDEGGMAISSRPHSRKLERFARGLARDLAESWDEEPDLNSQSDIPRTDRQTDDSLLEVGFTKGFKTICATLQVATKVMAVLVRLVGADVVQKAGDVVEECFHRLDEYHGYDVIVQNLMGVLGEVIKVIEADEPLTQKEDQDDMQSSMITSSLEPLFEWLSHRKDLLPHEDATDHGPAPYRACGTTKADSAEKQSDSPTTQPKVAEDTEPAPTP